MNAKIQLIEVTPDEIVARFTASVDRKLDNFLKHYQPKQPTEYLTKRQVADLFNVNISTICNWQKSGVLRPKSIGSRIYFLKSDIDSALISLN